MRYVIAALICIAIIGGLTALVSYMQGRAQFYIQAGIPIPFYERILFGLAVFWKLNWVTVTPLILMGVFGIAALLHEREQSMRS